MPLPDLVGAKRAAGDHDDPFVYVPFIWRPEYASMPSGHATTAAATAIAVGAIWPGLRVVMGAAVSNPNQYPPFLCA